MRDVTTDTGDPREDTGVGYYFLMWIPDTVIGTSRIQEVANIN